MQRNHPLHQNTHKTLTQRVDEHRLLVVEVGVLQEEQQEGEAGARDAVQDHGQRQEQIRRVFQTIDDVSSRHAVERRALLRNDRALFRLRGFLQFHLSPLRVEEKEVPKYCHGGGEETEGNEHTPPAGDGEDGAGG